MAALASQRREPAGDARLTLREREILRLVDDGLSNKEIAQRLSLQTKTVKNHVSNILAKLGVANRAAAAAALRGSRGPLRQRVALRSQAHFRPTRKTQAS